jgi:glycine/serine hydroxymethyltransferase
LPHSVIAASGKLYNAVQYGVDAATGLIDYSEIERLAVEHKPKMIVALGSRVGPRSTAAV